MRTGGTTGHLEGLYEVIGNLHRKIANVKSSITSEGLWDVVFIIESTSKPLCPVRTGNLINSWFGRVRKTGGLLLAEVGYGASYALAVHEIDRLYRKPGSQWKYLEAAIASKTKEILAALKASATRGLLG